MFKIGVERGTSSLGNDKIFLSETKLHVKLTCPRLRLIPRWFPLAGNIRAHFCGATSALWVSWKFSPGDWAQSLGYVKKCCSDELHPYSLFLWGRLSLRSQPGLEVGKQPRLALNSVTLLTWPPEAEIRSVITSSFSPGWTYSDLCSALACPRLKSGEGTCWRHSPK